MAAWPLPLKVSCHTEQTATALVTFPSIRYYSDPSSEAAAIYTEQATKARKNFEFPGSRGLTEWKAGTAYTLHTSDYSMPSTSPFATCSYPSIGTLRSQPIAGSIVG